MDEVTILSKGDQFLKIHESEGKNIEQGVVLNVIAVSCFNKNVSLLQKNALRITKNNIWFNQY